MTIEELEDIEDKPHVGWKPRLLTGGKGPPTGPVVDWLSELPLGTTFVAQPVSSTAEMNLYHVVFKALPKVVLLTWRLPDGKMLDMYFNPEGFCRLHKNYKILGTQPVSNEEEENEQRNLSGPADVDLHEAVQRVDQVVSGSEEPDVPA